MQLSPTHTFSNKYLADLAFILLSPELFRSSEHSFFLNEYKVSSWLKEEQCQSEKIDAHFENYDIRKLGWYAEKLMEYFFSNFDDFRLIANNIQLFENKITKGEIDFLIEDILAKTITQVELATKYYIKYNGQYIGPNAKDNLEKKYNRLVHHQLLKETPEDILRITGNQKISAAKFLVKGIIFYPYDSFIVEDFKYPTYLNRNHQKGWHLCFSEFLLYDFSTLHYIPKSEWFGLNNTLRIDKNEFPDFFKQAFQLSKAIMVLDEKGNRGFITSDEWPN